MVVNFARHDNEIAQAVQHRMCFHGLELNSCALHIIAKTEIKGDGNTRVSLKMWRYHVKQIAGKNIHATDIWAVRVCGWSTILGA